MLSTISRPFSLSFCVENEIKKLSDKTGLPLEDHLADVKDVHKTENLAAFLLEPVRTMGKCKFSY